MSLLIGLDRRTQGMEAKRQAAAQAALGEGGAACHAARRLRSCSAPSLICKP